MKRAPIGQMHPDTVEERMASGVARPIATHLVEYRWLEIGEPPRDWTCEFCSKPADALSCPYYAAKVLKTAPKGESRNRNNADALGDFPFYQRSHRSKP